MNLLLANLNWSYGKDDSLEKMRHLHFPLGLAIIAGQIRHKRTDELLVIDNYVREILDDDVFQCIEDYEIDCILLSMFLGNYQYRYLKKFINDIALRFPQVSVIVGGPLASTVSDLLLENTTIASGKLVCVIGEGEDTIIDLLSAIEAKGSLSKVKGIAYKDTEVVVTEARPRIRDLDGYPPLAYDLFETRVYVDYVEKTNRCWELIASRGCFGSCVFCKRVFGSKISMRSASSVVQEMVRFYEEYGVSRFNFVDDNFLNHETQVRDFVSALQSTDMKFRWRFQGRADRFSPQLANALVDVGLYDVSFGLESGSPQILDEMKKLLDLKKASSNLKYCTQIVDTHGNFIVGMPGESHDTVECTLQFIHETGIKYASAGILTIFPGTPLHAQVKRQGLITDEDAYCDSLGPVYTKPYINLTSYSDEQLLHWRDQVNRAGTCPQ